MNTKTIRKYELVAALVGGQNVIANLTELAAQDFAAAFDMWEYNLAKGTCDIMPALDMFQSLSEQKTRTLFCESLPLQKLVYSAKDAHTKKPIAFLTQLVILGKLDIADECLMRLRANTHNDFNETIRLVVDDVFAASCAKHNSKVPVFNKKQKELLLSYINKIKGPNKALLLQRMKEI
jgi:hypothetical protein